MNQATAAPDWDALAVGDSLPALELPPAALLER